MSDIDTGITGTTGATSRTGQARELLGQAGETLKAEAQSFASAAQDRVRSEAHRGAQAGARTLGDFANAVRRAGDELASADQSPASRIVRQAADGLESLSRNLAGKEPGDLVDAVRDFGRRNPAAFIGGAVLAGIAIGRFVRASEKPHMRFHLSEQDLAHVEEDAFDGPAELGASGGLAAPIADDLGDLTGSDPAAQPTQGLGDGQTDLTQADPAATPGGR
ncbi:hypothetical protein [Phenylobacterium sp.]|uniref:hypothetical protein n=1 Tax=Phenylobacterium sp. TaxID=1871053 RepID=UPI0025EACC79|nr:hypothetical protein [Phenylobacterium sp.]MBX3486177.1 hypothetical protein [Phenylobacterium sp.]MCW5760795.1 hypothetical protein [Phenylobacterium sp.]